MSEVENPETAPVKYIRRIKMGRCNCEKNDANPNQPIVNRHPEQGILAVKVEEGVPPNFCWTNQATGKVELDISGNTDQFELTQVREPDGVWKYLVKHFEDPERHRKGVLYVFWLQETQTDRNTVEAIRRVIEGQPATLLAEERERASARLHRLSEESTPSPSVDEAGPSEPAPRLVPQPPRENFPHQIPRRPDPINVDQLAAEIVDKATKHTVFIQQAVENAGVADRAPQPIVETPASITDQPLHTPKPKCIIKARMGKCVLKHINNQQYTVYPDSTPGLLYVKQRKDGIRLVCWMNLLTGKEDPGLECAPGDAKFLKLKQCLDGTVFLLMFDEDRSHDPTEGLYAYWMQEDTQNSDLVGSFDSAINKPMNQVAGYVADRPRQPIVETPASSIVEPSAAPTVVTTAASIIYFWISAAVVAGVGRQAAIINHILANAGVADRPPQPLDEPSTAPIVDVPAGPVENVRDEEEEEEEEEEPQENGETVGESSQSGRKKRSQSR